MSEHTITLTLREATDSQLERARSEAVTSKLRCEQQGRFMHTWGSRIEAIEREQRRRRGATNAD